MVTIIGYYSLMQNHTLYLLMKGRIHMSKQIRTMMIGAHPDDCDFRCGGLAFKYARTGHALSPVPVE